MPATIVVGLQWGDEGKGKIVDMLANSGFHAVVRFGGGNNAGHTIHNEHGRFALHLVPAGIFNPDTLNIIERGVVVHPTSLIKEMDELLEKNVSLSKLKISPFAHMVMPWHIAEDRGREIAGTTSSGSLTHIGTTLRGIGPCYQDKAGRWQAFRVGDLINRQTFLEKLEKVYISKALALQAAHGVALPSLEDVKREYLEASERIVPHIADTSSLIRKALYYGKNVLCEGAQGTLLDVDFGSYPYVTSSNTTSIAACMLTGINPSDVSRIIGVAKAYVTRVGAGPFPTRMDRETEEQIREFGKEYGATTGRPRLCGWLDLPLLHYACDINHITEIALTKMDVLGFLDPVKICTHYKEGTVDMFSLSDMTPVLGSEIHGWGALGECRERSKLPDTARQYIERIEAATATRVRTISIGQERNETIT